MYHHTNIRIIILARENLASLVADIYCDCYSGEAPKMTSCIPHPHNRRIAAAVDKSIVVPMWTYAQKMRPLQRLATFSYLFVIHFLILVLFF